MPAKYKKHWTEHEKQQLQFWWGTFTVKVIAKRLDRTPYAITSMARDLKLGPPSRGLISLEQFEKESGFTRLKIEAAAFVLGIPLKRIITSVPESKAARRFAIDEEDQEVITKYMLDHPIIFTNKPGHKKTTQGMWGVGWKPDRCLTCERNDIPHYSKGRCSTCARQHLRKQTRKNMNTPITGFTGNHRFLSNFFSAPVKYEGHEYSTVEHAFQAAKTLDLEQRKPLQVGHGTETSWSPGKAKVYGRRLTLRPDWEDVKLGVMEELVRQKFSNPSLQKVLLLTGSRELIEGNTWGDRFWGMCPQGSGWSGENHLGKILMKIRAELQEAQQ